MISSREIDHIFKVIIIGDSEVGKTSLLMRFCNDSFNPAYLTTIGLELKGRTIQVGDARVKLQLWDTAGQERFRSITSAYYRNAHGVIVAYDVTSERTFAHVKQWLQEINKNCSDTARPVQRLLIGNKCDDREGRMVRELDGLRLANENNIDFYETSAKTNYNVDEIFHAIAELILREKRQFIKSQEERAETLRLHSVNAPKRRCVCS